MNFLQKGWKQFLTLNPTFCGLPQIRSCLCASSYSCFCLKMRLLNRRPFFHWCLFSFLSWSRSWLQVVPLRTLRMLAPLPSSCTFLFLCLQKPWLLELFFCPQHTPASPYLQGIPTMTGFGPYLASSSPVMTVGVNDCMSSQIAGVIPQQMLAAQKIPRTDRLEVRTALTLPPPAAVYIMWMCQ